MHVFGYVNIAVKNHNGILKLGQILFCCLGTIFLMGFIYNTSFFTLLDFPILWKRVKAFCT